MAYFPHKRASGWRLSLLDNNSSFLEWEAVPAGFFGVDLEGALAFNRENLLAVRVRKALCVNNSDVLMKAFGFLIHEQRVDV